MHSDHNRYQLIIEIVGDATRQGTEGFQSLSAQKLCFQFFLFGNISADDEFRFRAAGTVPHQCPTTFDNDRLARFGYLWQFAHPLPTFQNPGSGLKKFWLFSLE